MTRERRRTRTSSKVRCRLLSKSWESARGRRTRELTRLAAIYAQFEELAEEFTIWSYSRTKVEDERHLHQLKRTSQEIAAEEEKQGESHEGRRKS